MDEKEILSIQTRLNRMEGQVRGVQRYMERDACSLSLNEGEEELWGKQSKLP
ncbi:hypothetical protein D3P07_04745 [Paenibacillus sp. 1011MAR3C5]|uniref:metal-sensing transcriptional repressor n=1 Tax=Paenibacillus sp. 1011MAR3C5 TaxID=1675787 RepID=UPI000E6CD899|nr:hypothetical protein D3P07_04745 [Paenibacillus sp. 1011MAR3C5]